MSGAKPMQSNRNVYQCYGNDPEQPCICLAAVDDRAFGIDAEGESDDGDDVAADNEKCKTIIELANTMMT